MAVIGAEAAGVLNAAGAPRPRAGAAERAAALESYLADPDDFTNPLGYEALLAADARAELSGEGERLLDRFVLNAEFVPRRLGGRFDSVEGLVRVLRPVFRRDAALGIGYGVATLAAALPSWLEGCSGQQRRTADLLLGGGRMAVAHHEPSHANDFTRDEFRADRRGSRFVVSGRKRAVANADRAGALVLYARTSPAPGARGHSVLLLDAEDGLGGQLRHLPRHGTNGVRGVRYSSVRLTGLPVSDDTVVGEVGQGVELALRSCQITRAAVPSMALGLVDTCLRTAVRYADERGRASGTGVDSKSARPVAAAAFADLLLCDALCLAAARAVSLLPDQTGVYAAAVDYLVPRILGDTVHDLSVVLGSSLYDRDSPYGIFAKHMRDLPATGLGHAGSAACLATVVPQLPLLAAKAWFGGEPAPAELFDIGGPLPEPRMADLRPVAGQDALAATLVAAAENGPRRGGSVAGAAVHRLAEGFLRELRSLRTRVAAVTAAGRGPAAVPEMSALADRYAHVLAAAACLGLWEREQSARPAGFLADPAWLVTALARIAARLGGLPGLADAADLAAPYEERLADEVVARHRGVRGYDLYETPLSG